MALTRWTPTVARPAQVLVLYTSVTSDKLVRVAQERLERLLYVRGVPATLLDAADAANKPAREALFAVSGLRAVYPQVFLALPPAAGGGHAFVGDWKAVHAMNEHNEQTGAFDAAFRPVPAFAARLPPARAAWLDRRREELARLAAAWAVHTSRAGDAYYWNAGTGESAWVDPRGGVGPGGQWVSVESSEEDAAGNLRSYWYNWRTGKSTWRVPLDAQ